MAKRDISGTLRNLKYMERASLIVGKRRMMKSQTVVLTDWDPEPGALVGQMSFMSFNPSIEKLNEEALNGQRTDGSTKSCSSKEVKMSFSQNASCLDEPDCMEVEPSRESNSDMKRKHSEGGSEQHYPNKLQKNGKGNAFKQQKGKNMDWSVL